MKRQIKVTASSNKDYGYKMYEQATALFDTLEAAAQAGDDIVDVIDEASPTFYDDLDLIIRELKSKI